MSNRRRSFDCAIAGKSVTVALRPGGGTQEPEHVYVRCDQRDCQYVDLNTAPCPLNPRMFDDGSDRRVGEHLQANAGSRLCYGCLTEALELTHDQVRRAAWRLRELPGVAIRPARCGLCHRRGVTIGLPRDGKIAAVLASESRPAADNAPAIPATILDMVRGYLHAHSEFRFCAHCLARELGARASAMREAMWALEREPPFALRTTQCANCLLMRPAIAVEQERADDGESRVVAFLAQTPGAAFCATCIAFSMREGLAETRRLISNLGDVPAFEHAEGPCSACGRAQSLVRLREPNGTDARHYGGYRIALMSFRTKAGWRPLAIVRGGEGAMVPDAPAIVCGLTATQAEADRFASIEARAWVDKRIP